MQIIFQARLLRLALEQRSAGKQQPRLLLKNSENFILTNLLLCWVLFVRFMFDFYLSRLSLLTSPRAGDSGISSSPRSAHHDDRREENPVDWCLWKYLHVCWAWKYLHRIEKVSILGAPLSCAKLFPIWMFDKHSSSSSKESELNLISGSECALLAAERSLFFIEKEAK